MRTRGGLGDAPGSPRGEALHCAAAQVRVVPWGEVTPRPRRAAVGAHGAPYSLGCVISEATDGRV